MSILNRINNKLESLRKRKRLFRSELDDLLPRLYVALCDEVQLTGSPAAKSRKAKAQRIYRYVQDADQHLFLLFLLEVSITKCSNPNTSDVADETIVAYENAPCRYELSSRCCRSLRDWATVHQFLGNPRYQRLVATLFPGSKVPTETGNGAVHMPSLPRPASGDKASQAPMRNLESTAPNTTLPIPTSRHLLQTVAIAATAPNLSRTRALAKAKLMSNPLALRRAMRPAAPPTQFRTDGVHQTQLQHINSLQARVRALETHVNALNKTLERWDADTWECLREMVQKLCEGNGQAEGEK